MWKLVTPSYCGCQELNSDCRAWGQTLLPVGHLSSLYSMVSEKDCLARSGGKLLLSSMQEAGVQSQSGLKKKSQTTQVTSKASVPTSPFLPVKKETRSIHHGSFVSYCGSKTDN